MILCFLSAKAHTPSERVNRGVSGFHHLPIKASASSIHGIPRQVILSALVGTFLTSAARVSKASVPIKELNSLPATIGVFFTGYKLEVGQYQSFVESANSYGNLTLLAAADDADSNVESLRLDASMILNEAKKHGYSFDRSTSARNSNIDTYSKTLSSSTLPSTSSLPLNSPPSTPLLFMGHSRGGAVAALAAATYLQSYISTAYTKGQRTAEKINNSPRNILLADKIINFPKKVFLVLLDPVDSSEKTVMHAIQNSIQDLEELSGISDNKGNNKESDKNTNISLTAVSTWPWPVLIISTPYGGSSSYYKVPYESACAPVGRNGDSFKNIFSGKNVTSDSDSVVNIGGGQLTSTVGTAGVNLDEKNEKNDLNLSKVVHVVLPDVGHTQLLDRRKESAIGSVCAGNEKISDKDVRGFIHELIARWISLSILSDSDNNSDDKRVERILEVKKILARLYPNIKTIWSI